MRVRDPDGVRWQVRRRWVPWRRRLKGMADVPNLPSLDLADDFLGAILLVVLLVVLVPAVIIGLIAIAELLILCLVLPFALLGRIAFGRHWTVDVYRERGFVLGRDGGSYAESGALVQDLAARIQSGRPITE